MPIYYVITNVSLVICLVSLGRTFLSMMNTVFKHTTKEVECIFMYLQRNQKRNHVTFNQKLHCIILDLKPQLAHVVCHHIFLARPKN